MQVETVAADLSTPSGVAALLDRVGDRPIEVLVNNAGFGSYGPFVEADADREADEVAVDVSAVVGHTAIYRRLGDPEPVIEAGLRALDKGRAVVIVGARNNVVALSGRFLPREWLTRVSARLLRPVSTT